MLPRVLYHVAASVDGRVDHIQPDLAQFYGVAGRWGEDCTLTGADTLLAAPGYAEDPGPGETGGGETGAGATAGPATDRPLLAVVDSRGRVRNWRTLRAMTQYWRGPVALVSRATPAQALARVRVDSGGSLAGALLRAGLVHEVSVLVQPALVGGDLPRTLFRAPELQGPGGAVPLSLLGVERLDGDVVWLRYEATGTA